MIYPSANLNGELDEDCYPEEWDDFKEEQEIQKETDEFLGIDHSLED